MFARNPRLPVDIVTGRHGSMKLGPHVTIWKQMRKNMQRATERMIKAANKRRRQYRYAVGDKVWVSTTAWNPRKGSLSCTSSSRVRSQ